MTHAGPQPQPQPEPEPGHGPKSEPEHGPTSEPGPAPTGRAGGDPAAGAGNYGRPRHDDVDPDLVPRAPSGLSVPRASDEPPGAVVSPSGPRVDLPIPPAMQYPPGEPLGPAPGQQRPGAEPGTAAGGNAAGPNAPAAGNAAVGLLAPARAVPAGTTEWVTCPECGETAAIDPAQRRSEDFCARCDFPLFWARSAIIAMSTDDTGASLRRLPGTVGRAATASIACPHCGEPNSPTALICIRCSLPMVIATPEPEPEPEPVYIPPPPPEPEPEPGFPLWWVVGACVALIIITVIVAWIALAV